jgi:hypothetical protein
LFARNTGPEASCESGRYTAGASGRYAASASGR